MEILCYTRKPEEDAVYGCHMAYSMHLAYRGEDGTFRPFHHNEGILYAKAVEDESNGVLDARGMLNPWIFALEQGDYGVMAIRTKAGGEEDPDSRGCVLFFTSRDLVHYEERGLCQLDQSEYIREVRCCCQEESRSWQICFLTEGNVWKEGCCTLDGEGNMRLQEDSVREVSVPGISAGTPSKEELEGVKGCVPGNCIQIPEDKGDYLLKKLLVPVCIGMELSDEGPFTDEEAVKKVKAAASYSDGSKVERSIDWEAPQGKTMRGKVHQETLPAPFAENRADPVCMYRGGKYYFLATNDADGNHTLYMRCADTLEGIAEAEETLFLDSDTYPGIRGLLWAPEFHEVGGRLYVFHAATSGEFFCEESRVREMREGGDPMCREDWSEPRLVVISLDMTVFGHEGRVYAMWSQRQFLPVDQGAWLYLAQVDEREPWKLLSDPICVAKPEYGWENNHTYVVEGPYALKRNGKLMVTYAAAAVDSTYTVGLLKLREGGDILDPASWTKSNYPLMSSSSAEGQYGPGHNSYVTDENGLVWNFYHMRAGLEAPRSSAARRVHFDIDGEPMLDVTEELDLPEAYRWVEAVLV